MTLQEILDAIMERYPHALSVQNIIGKVNTVQRELFRTIYRPITTTTYDLIAGNPFYPVTYSPETITDVVVNGKEYPFQNTKLEATSQFYFITDDNCIGLYPTPTADATSGLTVFRYKEPMALSTDYLGNEPDFDKAFHMLIVYYVCKELAAIALDSNMADVFVSEYNGLLAEFRRSKRAKSQKIENVYGGVWR